MDRGPGLKERSGSPGWKESGLKERSGSPGWTNPRWAKGAWRSFPGKVGGAEYGQVAPPPPASTRSDHAPPSAPQVAGGVRPRPGRVGLAPDGAFAADGGGSSLNQGQRGWLRTAAVVLVAVVLVSVVGGSLIDKTRQRRARSRSNYREVRATSEEDVAALSADLHALDATMGVVDVTSDQAMAELAAARESFEKANERLAQASKPEDLAAVSSALEDRST